MAAGREVGLSSSIFYSWELLLILHEFNIFGYFLGHNMVQCLRVHLIPRWYLLSNLPTKSNPLAVNHCLWQLEAQYHNQALQKVLSCNAFCKSEVTFHMCHFAFSKCDWIFSTKDLITICKCKVTCNATPDLQNATQKCL
jgi:hypothetical protein